MDNGYRRQAKKAPLIFIFFAKIMNSIKKYINEIIVGVVIGLIILLVTPIVNDTIANKGARNKLINDLSSVSLGMSKNYVDGLLGQPIIEHEYEDSTIWYSESQIEETFISAGYKLMDSVLLCLYCDKELVAFVVVVNDRHIYRMPNSAGLGSCYLLDFTYEDFSKSVGVLHANVPANNDTYAFYSELHYGAGPANYNYFIVGSYKDYRGKPEIHSLMFAGQSYELGDSIFYPYDEEEFHRLRKNVQPNVFGVVSPMFASEFSFINIVATRENGTLLFGSWP